MQITAPQPIPPVRLTHGELSGLRAAFENVFASYGNVEVYLFGSRARLDHKGGDIDLLVVCAEKPAEAFSQLTRRLRMAVEDQLGEQKIDIVWDAPGECSALIPLARQQGVLLWQVSRRV